MMHKEEEKTMVLWPIPDGHDPCLISQRIESALKNSGQWRYRSGPLYITAFGNLTEIPGDDDVLRKLSSTGVALKHGHDVRTGLLEWTDVNPAPATIMLISDSKELEPLAHTLYDLEHLGYSILLAYPQRAPAPDCLWQSFLSSVSKECLWNSLLSDDDVIWGMTNRKKQDLFFRKSAVKPMNLPGLAQYAIFLDKALKISPRISREWDMEASHNNVDRLDPANIPKGQSNEWYLLYNQDVAHRTSLLNRRSGPFKPLNIATNTMVQQSQPKNTCKKRNTGEEAVDEENPE